MIQEWGNLLGLCAATLVLFLTLASVAIGIGTALGGKR